MKKNKLLLTTLMTMMVMANDVGARDDSFDFTPVVVRDPESTTCSNSSEICVYDAHNRLVHYLRDQYDNKFEYRYTYDDTTGRLINFDMIDNYLGEDAYLEIVESVKFDPVTGNKIEEYRYNIGTNAYAKYDPITGNKIEAYRFSETTYAEYGAENGNVIQPFSGTGKYEKYDATSGMVLEEGEAELNFGSTSTSTFSITSATPETLYTYETNDQNEIIQIKYPAEYTNYLDAAVSGDCSLDVTIYNSDGSEKESFSVYKDDDGNISYSGGSFLKWSEDAQAYIEYTIEVDDDGEYIAQTGKSYSTLMNALNGITVEDEQENPEPSLPSTPTTTSVQNADGSYTIYDENGKIIGFKGKKIYTIEEATLLSKPTGNQLKIRYK